MTNPLPQFNDLIEHIEEAQPEGTALQHLADSVDLAAHLSELADHLIGHFVDQARDAGASWAEIGSVLGVTKQAAQKRFVTGTVARERKPLFARFDDPARSVVVRAQEYSREGRHDQVTTGHVLLALLDDPNGVTSRVIGSRGASAETVRQATRAALGPGEGDVPDHTPFAADAKKVLELSLREALRMQTGHIGAEHILLAILRDEKSPGARVLAGFGVDRKQVERAIAG